MQSSLIPKAKDGFTLEKFDGEILLYSEEKTQAVYLNDSAHAIWLLCKEGLNIGKIATYLQQRYPGKKEQIEGDVMATLNTLQQKGVIEFIDEE